MIKENNNIIVTFQLNGDIDTCMLIKHVHVH